MTLGLTRFNPFRSPSAWTGFPSLLDDMFQPFFGGWGEDLANRWLPAVDVAEERDRVVVTADMPGYTADEVSIEVEGNVLTISGSRESKENKEKKEKDVRYTLKERVEGRFTRTFALPAAIDRDSVEARFQDGVLTVVLPKKAEARPRQIRIESGDSGRGRKAIAA